MSLSSELSVVAIQAFHEIERGLSPSVKAAVARLRPRFRMRLGALQPGETAGSIARQLVAATFLGLTAAQSDVLAFDLVAGNLVEQGQTIALSTTHGIAVNKFGPVPSIGGSLQQLRSAGAGAEAISAHVKQQQLTFIEEATAAMSRISKSQHETAKSIIANLRA
jgi:hypothetical protein